MCASQPHEPAVCIRMLVIHSRLLGQCGRRADFHELHNSVQHTAAAASLLLIPLVGFLPADDPRVKGTTAAIENDLMVDGLIRRYRTDQTEDGLPGSEGVFLACSFWYVDSLFIQGRHTEARRMFDRLLTLCNDVGLLAEEYDPVTGRQLGNFPQAFSHLALINTALNLDSYINPVSQRSQGAD